MRQHVRWSKTAVIVMGTAACVMVAAALLWLLGVIRPPAGIFAAGTASLVILASGLYGKASP